MISFANPHALYLLVIIPIIAALYMWARFARKRKLRLFGKPNVIAHLMPDASRYMGGIKIVIELVALTLIILAYARPYMPTTEGESGDEENVSGIEVMICCDVSNSMLASSTDDPNGVSRLQRAKFLLEKMIGNMSNDKVGLIVFAGDSYTQLPITSDYISARMFVNDLSTDMVPTQGTAIGTAIDMAVNSFTPESDFQKAIVLLTDGENFEDNAIEASKHAAEAGIQVDVIGLGTAAGAPIPVLGKSNEYMFDEQGNQVITKLNVEDAKAIAQAGNGIYISGASSSAASELNDQLKKLSTTEYKRFTAPNPASELFPIAVSIALILVLIDILLPYSKIEWLKKFTFFSKTSKQ